MNISQYENRNFEGVDVNLETSLLEYGLIWKEYKRSVPKKGIEAGDTYFIIGTQWSDDGQEFTNTDWSQLTKADLLGMDWVDWNEVADYNGCTIAELQAENCGRLAFNLVGYYGTANVFGLYY